MTRAIAFLTTIVVASISACGASTAPDPGAVADGAPIGAGGQAGSFDSDGAGGGSQTRDSSGVGGGAGTTTDSAPSVACRDDGGTRLASVARRCAQDSDCKTVIGGTCCGADEAYGVANAQAGAYASCFGPLPPGACQGLGCAKFLGYSVDTGEMTVFQQGTDALRQIAVHCKNELCTTILAPGDAGKD